MKANLSSLVSLFAFSCLSLLNCGSAQASEVRAGLFASSGSQSQVELSGDLNQAAPPPATIPNPGKGNCGNGSSCPGGGAGLY